MNKIRVVLVDDHKVVRRGLRSYLESFADMAVVGEASSGEGCLAQIESWLPDVVVMDFLLPGGMDGIAATEQVRQLCPQTKVVVLTAHTDEARVIAALRAGAIGYVQKDADPEFLLTAVRAAAKGQAMLDPTIAGSVLQEVIRPTAVSAELTEREMTVLRLLAHGKTNKEIAAELFVSEETVKTHVGNILTKLHMNQRTQAVIAALKQGLISLNEIDL
ncbi:MAG: response regulator transcription factor [Chloroflexi bacterium]|nr:response regulator transcription factor [Chloroflexota bacterium]